MNWNEVANKSNSFARQVTELIENEEAEKEQMARRKQKMTEEIDRKRRELKKLEMEKANIDAELMSLRLQDKAYQAEHSNLRNAITVIKFQIGKIKESIEETEKNELEDLREFEKAVDEITETFRASPAIYDRKNLSQKLDEEKEKRKLLLQRIQETKETLANFNKEKRLRERTGEDEEFLSCILPGSELHYLMEMTNNLDEVIRSMKKHTKNVKKLENKLEQLDADVIDSKIAEAKSEAQKDDDENAKTTEEDQVFFPE